MKKLTKISVIVALIMAAFSLVYTAPTYAESCDALVEECNDETENPDDIDEDDEVDGESVAKGGLTVAAGVANDAEDDAEADAGDGVDVVVPEGGDKKVLDSAEPEVKKEVLRLAAITPVYLTRFLEVGETITVTDALADDWGYSLGMSFSTMSFEKSDTLRTLSSEPITIVQGEGGVFSITVNEAGSYNVWFSSGEQLSTSIMINAVQFTDTDDPTLSEIIENFKAAMKEIEAAINSGDSDAMQVAWQGYSDAMMSDAEKFYGLDEYDRMTALMRVMSLLIYGEDVVVEQYVYEYTEEDYEYIYEYDAEYAAILDELKAVLAEAGYTENISVYDFDLAVYNNSEDVEEDGERDPIAWLNNLSSEREIVIEADSPEEGYERRYIAARAHFEGYQQDADGNFIEDENGNWIPIWSYALIDHVDFDAAAGLLSVWSDKFSVFALSYVDVLIPKTPNTGVYTTEGGATSSSSLSMMFAMIAVVMAFGAVKIAKRK
ncbi:hypothetical protein IKT18_02865 [Candidatus Saccharibacteria bacterium]|nr:hypothetical protein [Candidatus Saccharibacteria bacterium]